MHVARRQEELARAAGFQAEWSPLPKPKEVSGVGDKAKTCREQVKMPGVLANGDLIRYNTPVVEGSPSPLPGLWGLLPMARENTYFGTANGLMAMIPAGSDNLIKWPAGTRFNQTERAPSGHWVMTTTNWELLKGGRKD